MATGSVESQLRFSSSTGREHIDSSLPSTSTTPTHFPIILPPFLNRALPSMAPPTRQTEPAVFVVDDQPQTIIDLTIDEPDTPQRTANNDHPIDGSSTRATRPPNFDRDIIDVDALPDRPPSPEVQFTFSRPAPPRTSPRRRFVSPARPVEPHPNRPGNWDFLFGGVPQNGQGTSGGGGQSDGRVSRAFGPFGYRRLQDLINARNQSRLAQSAEFIRRDMNHRRPAPQFAGFISDTNPNFTVPDPDYEVVGLREPPPRYDPPKPAQEGFTRSPKEGDTVVCPNCDDELGTGDTEEKRSVWFVKGCGHVSYLNSSQLLSGFF